MPLKSKQSAGKAPGKAPGSGAIIERAILALVLALFLARFLPPVCSKFAGSHVVLGCHAGDARAISLSVPLLSSKYIYIYIYTRNFALASLAQVPSALRAGFISEARLYRNHVCFRQSSQGEEFGRLLAICFSCLDRPWEGFLRTLAMRPLSHCQGSPEDTPKQFAMIFALHVVWERCWAGGEECARECLP